VLFWVGLVVTSVLFGDVFRAFNPWLAVGRATSWAGRRAFGRPPIRQLAYPAWLGRWPAAIGILAFAFLELAYIHKDDPAKLAILALAYAGVQLAGMASFGVDRWSRDGDAFGVYFNMFAHLSVFERHDGVLYVLRAGNQDKAAQRRVQKQMQQAGGLNRGSVTQEEKLYLMACMLLRILKIHFLFFHELRQLQNIFMISC